MKIKHLKDLSQKELTKLFNRFGDDFSRIMIDSVVPIVNDVRERGDEAVIHYAKKFDGIDLKSITAGCDELEKGYNSTPVHIRESFSKAIANLREFHSHQKKGDFSYNRSDGSLMGMKCHPVESAAIYVPGGKASYPSSVMMGVVPAQIAGVKNITLVTPCRNDAALNENIAAVCTVLGVDTVVKAGGAHGIAAAGFGTDSVKKADIIAGPGNLYVTAAKSYLFSMGIIQIDSLAGPSEVLVIADKNADPKWTAFDLLSQAEHEENAIAILLTDSVEFAEKVKDEINKDLAAKCGRHEIKEKSISANGLIIITENISEAIDFSNKYAPEHMQLIVKNPEEYLSSIVNVGSLFLGEYSPVAAGDYFSGTNHILPTGGSARFASGVSVETFMRRMTYQKLSEKALREASGPIEAMAGAEGFLDKHFGSVKIRFE